MRARKALWWGLPLVVVLGLATWAAHRHVQSGGGISWRAVWNALRTPVAQLRRPPQQDRDASTTRESSPAPAGPAFFSAVRAGERVTLSGSAPDSIRTALVAH